MMSIYPFWTVVCLQNALMHAVAAPRLLHAKPRQTDWQYHVVQKKRSRERDHLPTLLLLPTLHILT